MTQTEHASPPAAPENAVENGVEAPLQGTSPEIASEQAARAALEDAFDYRGDVTLTLRDGSRVEGFIFDRRSDGPALSDCVVRLIGAESDEKIVVAFSEITGLEFSGKDCAAGKSFETWMKKVQAKKLAEGFDEIYSCRDRRHTRSTVRL